MISITDTSQQKTVNVSKDVIKIWVTKPILTLLFAYLPHSLLACTTSTKDVCVEIL